MTTLPFLLLVLSPFVIFENDYAFISCPLCRLVGCVEVLRPSQPNGVMSSAVSLPNHTFTGKA